MGPFALRSAAVFVVVGIGLHSVVQELIERQFHDHAEFHVSSRFDLPDGLQIMPPYTSAATGP